MTLIDFEYPEDLPEGNLLINIFHNNEMYGFEVEKEDLLNDKYLKALARKIYQDIKEVVVKDYVIDEVNKASNKIYTFDNKLIGIEKPPQ